MVKLNIGSRTWAYLGKKPDWAIAMLERLGSDSEDETYVAPGAADVWDFVRSVLGWIGNPARAGTL